MPREDGCIAFDLVSYLEAYSMAMIGLGLHNIYGVDEKPFDKFNRNQELLWGDIPLIDVEKSFYNFDSGVREGSVYVLSIGEAKRGGSNPYHEVKPRRLASTSDSYTSKIDSLQSFTLDDDCRRSRFQIGCRIPEKWEDFYRRLSVLSNPLVSHVVDRHGFLASIWLKYAFDIEDFGFLSINRELVNEIKKIIQKVNKKGVRIENYLFGHVLSESSLLKPYIEHVTEAYGDNEPLVVY